MRTRITASALALGLSASAFAAAEQTDVQTDLQALKARVEQQDKEIAELRATEGDTWLNNRRKEEIKALVHEVLSDAETRASLQEGGLTAGWRDHFFLASEDGNFLLRLSGQVQTRYTYTVEPGDDEEIDRSSSFTSEEDAHTGGFNIRRAKVRFDGHLFDPKFTYAVQLNVNSFGYNETDEEDGEEELSEAFEENIGIRGNDPGATMLEDAWAAYEFADGWQVKVGQFKAPFLREELVDSKYQLAVERSFVADYYTVDYTQGIQVAYNSELSGTPVRAAAMLHDGSYQANTNFNADVTDFAIAGRVEALLAGTWEQFDDFAAWSSDSFGLMLGAAVDYEAGESGDTRVTGGAGDGENPADIFKWTVDVSAEFPELYGLNLYGALIGQEIQNNADENYGDIDQYGLVAQAGVFIIPDQWDVFARWEWIDFNDNYYFNGVTSRGGVVVDDQDEEGIEPLQIVTVGTNYYFQKHAAKATVDLVWLLNGLEDLGNPGSGIDANNHDADDQLVVRAQFQFLF